MEEEDCSPQNAIDERDSSVQARILFIGGQSADGETGKDERHDDQIWSLHDLSRGLLPLINPWQLPVLSRPGSLYEGEGEDGEDHDGDVLADHEGGVHLEPAVVLACMVRQSVGNTIKKLSYLYIHSYWQGRINDSEKDLKTGESNGVYVGLSTQSFQTTFSALCCKTKFSLIMKMFFLWSR